MTANFLRKVLKYDKLILLTVTIILSVNEYIYSQDIPPKPPFDVFEVMTEVNKWGNTNLWLGFEPQKIPLAVFDSENTYLFNHPSPPEGFESLKGNTDVYYYKGQFPLVRGNSRAYINNVRTATSVLSAKSKRTGEKYNLRDLAGIIIHEQFHVFQKLNHPNWRPNDGLLLIYPPETIESLFLRRVEKEAFKRAVISQTISDAAGWTKEALNYRQQRLALLDSAYINYEMELQRFEGISDYIEVSVRGKGPLSSTSITSGIAPAGVRDLGYVEGRWIALLLDRFDSEWKLKMEKGNLRVLNNSCISVMNNSFQIVKVIITGLSGEPQLDEKKGIFRLKSNGVSIDFKYTKIKSGENKFIIEL